MIRTSTAVALLLCASLAMPAAAAQWFSGSGGAGLVSPRDVHGKEYSDHMDECVPTFPIPPSRLDPAQNIAFRVYKNDPTDLRDAFDFTTVSGDLSDANSPEVDALANSQDAWLNNVLIDGSQQAVPIYLSFAGVPEAGNIYFHKPAPYHDRGLWLQAVDINDESPPEDVDAFEMWTTEFLPIEDPPGPTLPEDVNAPDDANMFSIAGDPFGVAIYRYNPPMGASSAYISTAQLQSAIDTNESVDLDALMVWDSEDDGQFNDGDRIIFSIKAIGPYDGGELWVWQFGAPAYFLSHGGHLWDTAFEVGAEFGLATEEVNALEAGGVPEPASLLIMALGGLTLIRRRGR